MHIVQVDIDNFKSFSRKTSISFFDGYTVISGPNGSGKSNIIDAILFVLSLSSSRNLRADNMSDFFNTTSGKNTAEVTLEFSDGTRIRRKIKKTPSSVYSYYYLNDKTSSQVEILDFLAKNGIRPHGYNVVMQNELTHIMSMSDRERRGIVDTIAGVAEFDQKKEQALEELEQVRAQIEREELLLEEYNEQLTELSVARGDAVKWVKLNKEHDYYTVVKKSADIRKLESELAVIATSRQDHEAQRATHEESKRMEENKRDARKEEVRDLDQKIAEKQGPEYLKIIAGMEEQKGNIRSAEDSITNRKKDKELVLAFMNQLYMDIQKYQSSYNDKNKEMQKLKIDRANLVMELENQNKVLAKAKELVSKHNKDSHGARQELVDLMDRISKKKEERSAVVVQRDGIIEQSRIRASELDRYNRHAADLAEERIQLVTEEKELNGRIVDLQDERRVIVKQIAEAERKMMNVKKNLGATQAEITRLNVRQAKLEGEQRAAGGSDRSIEAISSMEGVYGTIAKLGKVLKAQHTVALNIAAAGRLKNLIVENDQVGADCIRYLKEEGLGRLTFLPLNKLKESQWLPPLAGNGVIDYAINLIDFKPEYRNAFNLVFGQTVVIENLDVGRRLMGRYRMVTLDGELLEKAGSMTGGSVNKDVHGFGVFTGNEAAEIAAKIGELKGEEEDLIVADKRNEAVVSGLRDEKNTKDAALTEAKLRLNSCKRAQEKLMMEEAEAARLKEDTEKDTKERAAEIVNLEQAIEGFTDEIAKIQNHIDELKTILNEEEFKLLTDDLQKAQNSVTDSQRRLENKTNELNSVGLERKFFKERLDEKMASRKEAEDKLASYDGDIAGYEAKIAAAHEVIRSLEAEMKTFSSEIEELQVERNRVQNEADKAQLWITTLMGEIEKCKVQLDALDQRSSTISVQVAEMRGMLGEVVECEMSTEEIQDKLFSIERSIKRLGNVNQQAIEQYDELEKRTKEKTERKETLAHEREAILEKIESFKQMKHDAFMTAYRAINKNFQQIYRQLNDGAGQLVLDDIEDPFNGGMSFEVSPKGKEVRRLNMMSGGEKSLTTLSFIFAIQQYMPAPFYALDEVDSALDGLNVKRLSQLVRHICETSQFVIVSHREPMISGADRMMGVTVRPGDKSTLVTGVKRMDEGAAE